ncbi:MAG: preprotein translocase subunit SecG [Pyrinomonadaceae bacterium]
MTYTLYGLFILSCIVLVVAVLLQPGKADAGALFSSSVSSTAFGPRGTQTLLAKITIGAAALFMLVALVLSLPGLTGTRSVLQSAPADPAAPAPPQPSPAATTAPAETASPATNTGAAPQGNSNAPASTAPAANTETNNNSAPASTGTSPSPAPKP